jgi:hypothetical protein
MKKADHRVGFFVGWNMVHLEKKAWLNNSGESVAG